MGNIIKKVNASDVIQVKSLVKKHKGGGNSKGTEYGLSPMMPRRYSAKERKEIRRKELEILKGTSNTNRISH